MKAIITALILCLTGLELRAQMPPPMPTPGARPFRPRFSTNNTPVRPSYPGMAPTSAANGGSMPAQSPIYPAAGTPVSSGLDANGQPEEMIPPGTIDFQGVDVNQVLEVYAKLVHRTLIRGNVPQASIVLKTETPLTTSEAIEALHAVLALNNISVINVGEKFVKVVPSDQAGLQGQTVDNTSGESLPEMGSYVTHIVQLQWVKPTEMVPIIQPFARLQNSILPIDSNGILVLRDYSENVKRMLEMIARIDVSVPAEYISEVIPIKYALAADIASALNSLGGSGGATVSVGGSSGSAPISGISGGAARNGGISSGNGFGGTGTSGNQYQSGGGGNGISGGATFGQRPQTTSTTPNGTPAAGTSFQQRLNAIINRASGSGGQQQDIQVFGQAKIIADSRANSLLIFATRQDMDAITNVIAKLDVLLAQVLIESVIMDVSLGRQMQFGVSAVQTPQTYSPSIPVIGGGGMNNGQPLGFLSTIANLVTNYDATGTNILSIAKTFGSGASGTNGSFASSLPGGLSYFGSIGPNWNVAVTAAEQDNTANIIQRPRIQTSQAKQAQFFVGQTVPYVTGTSYGGGYAGGNSSQYSQLSVGVELDVTPFINPEGLVVMDVNQEIDDVSGYTTIDGNQVPNTDKRTLSSEIAVRDKDTIILGGFIRTDKSHSKSGVPFLQDIPIIGNLFTSRNDSKDRQELIVLMRPTVLRTPEISAAQTLKEERRLPGVSGAAADESADERKLIEAERKREMKKEKSSGHEDGFFTAPQPGNGDTQIPTNNMFTSPRVAPQTVPPTGTTNDDSTDAPAAPATPVTPDKPAPLGKDNGFFYDGSPK